VSEHASPSPSQDRSTPESDASLIAIDLRRLPGVRRLASDYGSHFSSIDSFVAGNPADPHAWADVVARSQAHVRDRDAIAEIVGAQQRRRHAPAAAIEAGARLAHSQTVAVLTGQQAGLFGGPMFTLLKALTALKLARQVETEQGVPAVAVFWIDAEDHDWDEVRGCTVFDESLTPRQIALPDAHEAALPVGAVRLGDTIVAAIDELEQALPGTEFRVELIAALRDAYTPGTGMADAFGRWIERVLGPHGLIVYDASDPAAKPLARGVFARELSSPGITTSLATRAGAALEAAGYHAQVHPGADAVALFRLAPDRVPIRQQANGFQAGDHEFGATDLVREAETHPTHFSPNVLLRPIVQDTIFPTICYVAGPNELAYLCQLRDVYAHFGVPMPLMYPRVTATILDSGAMRFLAKNHLPLEELQAQDESALNDLLTRQMPPEIDEAFRAAGIDIEARLNRLIEVVPTIDPTLEGAARSTLKRMQQDLDTLRGKMVQAAKRRDETLRRQFVRTRSLAFPGGTAQERAIGWVWFLNQYGPGLIDRLLERLPVNLGKHWILTV